MFAKLIDNKAATVGNGNMLGFKCGSLEQPKAFHDAGVAHGGASIEDSPGWRAWWSKNVFCLSA